MQNDIQTKKNDYNHPYQPYDIQIDFMNAVNETLNGGYKIGIFESPTGTGKTLSLICSTVTWLRSHYSAESGSNGNGDKEEEDDDEPAWVKESYNNMVNKQKLDAAKAYEENLSKIAANPNLKTIKTEDNTTKRHKRFKRVEIDATEDENFLPNDYHSDDESAIEKSQTLKEKNDAISSEIQMMLKNINKQDRDDGSNSEKDVKVLFASRTHSQLSQFSSQLTLPHFPSSIVGIEEHLKYLSLGSRKQLCIHEKVSKMSDVSLMNEACLDLQKQESKHKCEFFSSQKDHDMQNRIIEFRDHIFSKVQDIEDLNSVGKNLGVCPYYSTRKAIPGSEVITLPYQLLLQKSSRDALNISIKDCVVVIDEAHNLLDTIISLHSVAVTIDEFSACKKALKRYLGKFSRRLNGGNRVNIIKITKFIDLFLKYVDSCDKKVPGKEIDLLDVFKGTTGDMLNIRKLEKYLTVSKIAFKIESYMEKQDQSSTPTLFKVIEFLKAVSYPSKEGKFFFDVKNDVVSLNYMLLDPSQIFKEIVEEVKCVILAGGTMEPVEDYTNYLFPYLEPSKVNKFSCGHIIPKENLNVFIIDKNKSEFEFSFGKRQDNLMKEDFGRSLCSLMKNVPAGMVVFLPSYKFLADIVSVWKKSNIWNEINFIKKVFMESATTDVLEDYSLNVAEGKGSLLLSVVGGRLSEGINFSDDLARAVVMVGLPFPNVFSDELVSRKRYIESQVLEKTGDKRQAIEATKSFYENICMRAVNQSVGRSIRHRGDYSTIYFFDKRYHTPRIRSKLSNWIKERVSETSSFDSILKETNSFFREKKRK
ncbi:chromosome transmission fidelity protein 1 [Wickerhamomyces ciferrii]|uniref:ATP-dependent DNA helicase CHL1 n=1 Tax=Wickerhamomyces ciferrii (strain ATCC 14091 / BCRC 22168 / CBS 111 / JCM 3599 / NBRC 0793 / NRRL Y-1031 F-60-10) TaxID=1206466 RepID=K0KHY6_WICCF|nr:chromosome transmission fidelity protein 1 [Wickerhamomyces ciferrii]CCH41762.1 chromosome transmission fidelity protein 1 [Wickerhamomyces ciferrii]